MNDSDDLKRKRKEDSKISNISLNTRIEVMKTLKKLKIDVPDLSL
jgi:hypothetical protein